MLAHLICIGFTGFVGYVAKPSMNDPNWFAWHPTLMSAAFAFLAAESVFMLSRSKSILGDSASRSSKVVGHWMLMGLAVASAILGFLAVYLTKEQYGWPHLATPHAILGCVTVCYLLAQTCAGWNLIFSGLARKLIDMKLLRKLHGLSGCFLLLLATFALIGGLTTDWFCEKVGTGAVWYACLASPLIVYALIAVQVLSSKPKESSDGNKKK